MGRCRVVQRGRTSGAPYRRGTNPRATIPSPHPSGFRPRIGVRGMLLIAGMTNLGAGMTKDVANDQ